MKITDSIRRWTPKLKAEILDSIISGKLTRSTAIALYELSEEELASWERRYLIHGRRGLRTTRLEQYR